MSDPTRASEGPSRFSDLSIALVNLMNASRAAGFARGRGLDDTSANRAEDRAVDELKALCGAASAAVGALTEEEERAVLAGAAALDLYRDESQGDILRDLVARLTREP
jgi:hypothetical protein